MQGLRAQHLHVNAVGTHPPNNLLEQLNAKSEKSHVGHQSDPAQVESSLGIAGVMQSLAA